MTIFWILAVGLALLALLFVIPPLLSRQMSPARPGQDQLNLEVFHEQIRELDADLQTGNLDMTKYQDARRDLERELLHDIAGEGAAAGAVSPAKSPLTALILALALPAFAIGLYLAIGDTSIIPRLEMAASTLPASGHPDAGGQQTLSLDQMAQRLADRLEQNPEQLEGWVMLGRTYLALDKPDQGVKAFETALKLAPQDAGIMISLAQAIAAAAGGQLSGRPAELITAALAIDPQDATGRWLDGLLAYQEKDFGRAVATWEALVKDLDASSEDAEQLRQFIADARQEGGLAPADAGAGQAADKPAPPATSEAASTSPPSPSQTKDAAASGSSLEVEVSLAQALKDRADGNHDLFVYAKAATGPAMPLAAKRLRVADLPLRVTLDDSLALTPEMSLSKFPQVIVGARISASGQAMPQNGDLEGETAPFAPTDTASVKVLIDRVRP